MALSDQSRYTEGQFLWVNTSSRGNKYTVYLNTVVMLTTAYTIHIVREGDTMAIVAAIYYGDTGKWWIIADANPQCFNPYTSLQPGNTLRVPQ
jgi:hypothetical protein